MSLAQLIIAALATSEILEIWRHGKIFERQRARVELLTGWFGDLLTCPFCLSPWVAFFVVPPVLVPIELTTFNTLGYLSIPFCLLQVFVIGLAIARLANLLNDLTWKYNRTPKFESVNIYGGYDQSESEQSGASSG